MMSAGEIDHDLRLWDSRSQLRVRRTVSLDLELARQQLGLTAWGPALRLVVRQGTGHGRLPRDLRVLGSFVVDEETNCFEIDMTIDSARLSGRLWLLADLALSEAFGGGGALTPREPGTRVWMDSWSIELEQGIQRFPTEMGSFASLFPNRVWCQAPWCLRWYSTDHEQDLASALRLYLNTDREEHCQRVRELDGVVLQPVLADVMGQVIEQAGLDESAARCEDWPVGSVGEQAVRWRELAFPGCGPAAVEELRNRRPGEFRASVLAAAELATFDP